MNLTYKFNISKGDRLIINYKYNYKRKYKDILLLTEYVKIPEVYGTCHFCDYKLIISKVMLEK